MSDCVRPVSDARRSSSAFAAAGMDSVTGTLPASSGMLGNTASRSSALRRSEAHLRAST